MANSQLLGILLIAMVAGIILFRLYTVLGRRTGNERESRDPLRRVGGPVPAETSDKVVALADRTQARAEANVNPAASQGLLQIGQVDRTFETAHFLDGARHAYEIIVTAFAARDRAALRPLLSDEVYAAFDSVMRGHEDRKETVSYSFVGFKNTQVTHAELKGQMAEITVEFASQFISAVSDANGAVVEGDAKAVRDVVDVWTFARDVHTSDPNWHLVATSSGA
ncbi:MAG TPA: Tim44/TimA family putative adaptor protein [Rhizomicrobium sp.]|jgi:predicted lipid-binding transport protein (Tim44 family)